MMTMGALFGFKSETCYFAMTDTRKTCYEKRKASGDAWHNIRLENAVGVQKRLHSMAERQAEMSPAVLKFLIFSVQKKSPASLATRGANQARTHLQGMQPL
jgi:hypothetical protein